MGTVLCIVISIVFTLLINYLFLPAITFGSVGFWCFIIIVAVIFGLMLMCADYVNDSKGCEFKISMFSFGVAGVALVLMLGGALIGSPMFNAGTHANLIKVNEADISYIPTVNDLNKIPLMDTESAKKLGDRTVGSLTDIVSQYEVSDKYTTITYNDKVYKIAPLEYAGFFKYQNNKYDGIPGYVLVDTENNSAEFIKLDKGFKISDSACFGNDLLRTVRKRYASLIIADYNFQIDDEGNPYWVLTVERPQVLLSAKVVVGAIIMDAYTGASEYYDIDDVPEWVDYVITGDKASNYYDMHGNYQNGFWNSIFGQKGVTNTTDDFGYVSKDNDIWIYTGITSVNNDESNLGFIMVNSRTNECNYILCDGAEEYSGMSAAEGVVQNYGYKASFPALISVDGEPTYALVLKDANGLIKQYAFVNVKNYTIVTTATTLDKAYDKYVRALAGEDVYDEDIELEDVETTEAETPTIEKEEIDFSDATDEIIIVSSIVYHVHDGETYAYVMTEDQKAYKFKLADNENLLFVNANDELSIKFLSSDNNIYDATLK